MSHLTVQEFLTQQTDPEEDELDEIEPARSPADPLESIADSLRQFLSLAHAGHAEEQASDLLREAHDDLDAKHAVLYDLVEEIEAIIKPSTSKLAIQVREAIGRWRGVEPEPVEAVVEHPVCRNVQDGCLGNCQTECIISESPNPVPVSPPAKDAPVEDWRAYAVAQGVAEDVRQLNRSQIRTLLGISQAT